MLYCVTASPILAANICEKFGTFCKKKSIFLHLQILVYHGLVGCTVYAIRVTKDEGAHQFKKNCRAYHFFRTQVTFPR